MANLKSNADIKFTITMEMSESEARALEAITLYGADKFLSVFYNQLGTTYLKPHEKGIRELFKSVSEKIPTHLQRVDNARKTFLNN